jgi:resolvase-like protein
VRSTAEQKPKIRAAQYLFRAAHYVRAPTEHQQSSTQGQADKIKAYADAHGMEIVRTYADEGKSGLSTSGRASLTNLIADIEAGDVDFTVILVYDVSRWGRIQDTGTGNEGMVPPETRIVQETTVLPDGM